MRCCLLECLDTPSAIVLTVIQSHKQLSSQIWSYFSLLSCEGGPPIVQMLTCSACPLHIRAVNTSNTWHYLKKISAPNMTKASSLSVWCISQKELTSLYFQSINMFNLLPRAMFVLRYSVSFFCTTDHLIYPVMTLVPQITETTNVKEKKKKKSMHRIAVNDVWAK